ncbi:MAG: hypothetical protein K0U86_23010 [Planctomycetes bacterium]|nr:hypothetical protein [Planctomycetota bacterium]MCH9727781.1 hypothetical protein [Planctomycetota bacterium]MCH9776376.1 hypothetical protein [Planctomycetota bacterium]MCH9789427.1 hypothetical protein [Planctomycetota bacterium]MDF1745825.1 hypothetical protein [Gimesia sp.]
MPIIPYSFLFRHSILIPEISNLPHKRGRLLNLSESASIPDLTFDQESGNWGKVKVAWNKNGLGIGLKVDQKQHPTTSTDTFQVWIDTRDTKTIHRANRYCHLFEFHPAGKSRGQNKATCTQHPIHRAQADAPLCDLSKIQLWTKFQSTGYELDIWFPASVLNGFDPSLTPQLGLYYAISDSELGDQFMIVDHEFPFEQDPSLWATLRLESLNKKNSDESE